MFWTSDDEQNVSFTMRSLVLIYSVFLSPALLILSCTARPPKMGKEGSEQPSPHRISYKGVKVDLSTTRKPGHTSLIGPSLIPKKYSVSLVTPTSAILDPGWDRDVRNIDDSTPATYSISDIGSFTNSQKDIPYRGPDRLSAGYQVLTPGIRYDAHHNREDGSTSDIFNGYNTRVIPYQRYLQANDEIYDPKHPNRTPGTVSDSNKDINHSMDYTEIQNDTTVTFGRRLLEYTEKQQNHGLDQRSGASDSFQDSVIIPQTASPQSSEKLSHGKGSRGKIHKTTKHVLQVPPKPPDYMVQLYDLLSNTNFDSFADTVVTSYANIRTPDPSEDVENQIAAANHTMSIHTVEFNIGDSWDQDITEYAEIQLYVHLQDTLLDTATSSQRSNDARENEMRTCEVNIFEIVNEDDEDVFTILISKKNITRRVNGWESFNVTKAINNWSTYGVHAFQVRIEYAAASEADNAETDKFPVPVRKNERHSCLGVHFGEGKNPLLVVYSRKEVSSSHHRDSRRMRREVQGEDNVYQRLSTHIMSQITNREGVSELASLANSQIESGEKPQRPESDNQDMPKTKVSEHGPSDTKKKKLEYLINNIFTESDSLSPQYSNDIDTFHNSHASLLYSKDYVDSTENATFMKRDEQARIKYGQKEYFEEENSQDIRRQRSLKSNKNKIYSDIDKQKMAHTKDTVSKKDSINVWQNSRHFDEAAVISGEVDKLRIERLRRDTKSRYRRHLDSLFEHELVRKARSKRSKRKRNSCQRVEMFVHFEDIKWHNFIFFPKDYEAYRCAGKCYTPISEYLTPTKHAIIQTLIHTSYPGKASRACCVPTRLVPISILYWDDNDGSIKFEYYDEMVADDCGCR